MSYPVCSFTTERTQQCIVDILASLEAKPKTCVELGKVLGMPRRTVDRYLTHLHRGERKRIFICGVEKRLRGTGAPVFAVGSAPDVFEPILRSKPPVEAVAPQVVTLLASVYELPPTDPWLALNRGGVLVHAVWTSDALKYFDVWAAYPQVPASVKARQATRLK